MARVLLVALACCAACGEEYGGGAMPQYGAQYGALAEDYRGHSPDAPASLDYKYEEPQGETEEPPRYVDDSDSLRKSARRRTSRKELELPVEHGEAAPETSRRRRRRGRLERSRRDEQTARRRASTRFVLPENYLDNIDYFDDRQKDLKENDPILSKETTARANRRKSRERIFAPPPAAAGSDTLGSLPERNSGEMTELEDEEFIPNRLMKEDRDNKLYDMDFWKSGEEGERAGGPLEAPPPVVPESDVQDTIRQKQGRTNPSYQDYTDYYDIKQRINSIIKNKLPKFHRTDRPTTTRRMRVLQRTMTKHRRPLWAPAGGGSPRQGVGGAPAGASRRFEYDFGDSQQGRFNLASISGSRRLNYNLASAGASLRPDFNLATDGDPLRTDFALAHIGDSRRKDYGIVPGGSSRRMDYGIAPFGGKPRLEHDPVPPGTFPRPYRPFDNSTHSDLDLSIATTIASVTTVTDNTTTTTVHRALNATEQPIVEKSASDTKVLSLAEKSRLSILKKVLLKDKLKSPASSKPAVLLRVTSRLPTVVIVVPATSTEPWMRAREVAGDSPATLEKVKLLMRKKLVSSAQSIRELTDNWDQPVCDYIDMSMLDPLAGALPTPPPPLATSLIVLAAGLLLFM